MEIITTIIFTLISGMAIALQSGMSGQLGKILNSPLIATFTIYLMSTIVMGIILFFSKVSIPSVSLMKSVPTYLWFLGSLFSSFALSIVYWLMPRYGVAVVVTGVVSGQVLLSMIAAHFGWFDLPTTVMTGQKIFGATLLILSVIIINY